MRTFKAVSGESCIKRKRILGVLWECVNKRAFMLKMQSSQISGNPNLSSDSKKEQGHITNKAKL